jgi:hypothetical protein
MKKFLLFFTALLFAACQQSSYDKVRNYLDTIGIVDTHEHIQVPGDSADFKYFNGISYFPADMTSAGAPSFRELQKNGFDADKLWEQYGSYYNYSRATSYHEQFMNTLRILYDYDKPYLVKEDIKSLYDRMLANNYRNYDEWFASVYKKGKFKTMILDQYWDHFNINIDTSYFKLVCSINTLVMLVGEAAENKKITSARGLLQLLNRQELATENFDDYLSVVNSVLRIFKNNGAVCIKNTLAYSRSICFEDVPYEEASSLFAKKGKLGSTERKQLEDFIFHHIVQQSVELDMPIQIHTGYLAGNNSRLDNGQPMKLLNLFLKYPKARFSLFHGGYPWTGDFVAIGKNFTNVHLDLVWLPQISKTEAIRTLHEMLDAVPYNKIMWGGDVSWIDDSIGSLELGKEVVATVLAERVDRGWLTEELALEIAGRIFRDNALEFFKL